jgi:FdhE protein
MADSIERQSGASRFAEDLAEAISVDSSGNISTCDMSEHSSDTLESNLKSGRPMFFFHKLEVDYRAALGIFERLLPCFSENIPDSAEDLENLSAACQSGSLSAERLLKITLDNSWSDLRNIAQTHAINIDLLQLFTIFLARPFRQQAAEQMTAGVDLGHWEKGYCPVCGHSSVLGSILGKEGQRWLWCCCCNTRWRFGRIGCAFCENQSQQELGYLTAEEYPGYRIYVCDSCRRYLKEIISGSEGDDINFDYDQEYLASASLDAAALAQGYISEPIWINRYDPPGEKAPEVCSESKEI